MAIEYAIRDIMFSVSDLLRLIDEYKAASGVSKDSTVSVRLFKDGGKVAALRGGADITTTRFSAAVEWLRGNWPHDCVMPPVGEQGTLPDTASALEQLGDRADRLGRDIHHLRTIVGDVERREAAE